MNFPNSARAPLQAMHPTASTSQHEVAGCIRAGAISSAKIATGLQPRHVLPSCGCVSGCAISSGAAQQSNQQKRSFGSAVTAAGSIMQLFTAASMHEAQLEPHAPNTPGRHTFLMQHVSNDWVLVLLNGCPRSLMCRHYLMASSTVV